MTRNILGDSAPIRALFPNHDPDLLKTCTGSARTRSPAPSPQTPNTEPLAPGPEPQLRHSSCKLCMKRICPLNISSRLASPGNPAEENGESENQEECDRKRRCENVIVILFSLLFSVDKIKHETS